MCRSYINTNSCDVNSKTVTDHNVLNVCSLCVSVCVCVFVYVRGCIEQTRMCSSDINTHSCDLNSKTVTDLNVLNVRSCAFIEQP
jgi:hypothetical protein